MTFSVILILLLFSHSAMSDSATPWMAAQQASLSFNISRSLLKLMSIEPAMPANRLNLIPASCFSLKIPLSI